MSYDILKQAEQILRDNYDAHKKDDKIYLESIKELYGLVTTQIVFTHYWAKFQAFVVNDVMNKDIPAEKSMRQQAHYFDLHLPQYFYKHADIRVLSFMDQLTQSMKNGDEVTAGICGEYLDNLKGE